MVGVGNNQKMKGCASQNYTSCVTIKTTQVVDNTSSTSIEKKCGLSMDYTPNNETLNNEDIQTLYGGIGKDEFFSLENECRYVNETNTNVCRCLSNFCNSGSPITSIDNIASIIVILTINVILVI